MNRSTPVARLRWPALVAAVVAVSACATTSTTTLSPTSSPTLSGTTSLSAVTTTAGGDDAECLTGDLEFRAEGLAVVGSGAGDGVQISGIRWRSHPGCERVVVDLLTASGAPASTIGGFSVEMQPERGFIRLAMPPEVTTTGVADVIIDGGLAQRVFVVRRSDGSLAIDIRAQSPVPVAARALVVGGPSRIVVDLRPAGEDSPLVVAPPTIGDRVVVLSPAPGPTEYPLDVSGYARTFEATVLVQLVSAGRVAAQVTTTAADSRDAWGAFQVTIGSGPGGALELLVGEASAADGTFEGVTITLEAP
jgi:hypothetical protein